ncbi:chemokine (C-C motif) ligand 34b, duplicate 4 [Brachyistius frenatus]|uniref:chemokine (C-C motif) ligand 34b, duplicate 4 n=1 Tax=Brachyistius frenatus TaxID=100188 RepID=UPI0037E83270
MRVTPHLLLLLLLSVCLCVFSHSARHAGRIKHPCCEAISAVNISKDVMGDLYIEYPAGKHCVKAVGFRTEKGWVCTDPNALWVQRRVANMTKI